MVPKPATSHKKVRLNSLDRSLKVPKLGTTFKVAAVRRNGMRTPVPLVASGKANKFYALFDEEDLDFELEVNNEASRSRHVLYSLEMHEITKRFVVPKGEQSRLQTTERNGRKFHFLRRSSEEGQTAIATYAHRNQRSYKTAARVLSQLKLRVDFSQPRDSEEMSVYVNMFQDEKLNLSAFPSSTVADLKQSICRLRGSADPDDLRLTYRGKILMDNRTILEYGIQNNEQIFLTTALHGGAALSNNGKTPEHEISSSDESESDSGLGADPSRGGGPVRVIGERGVIVLGNKSSQSFFTMSSFDTDPELEVQPFTIELRMTSPYGFASAGSGFGGSF